RARYIGSGYIEIPDSVTNWQEAVEAIMAGNITLAHSHSRHMFGTLKYGTKSIGQWMFRGFRKI
ncbi:MAG: metal-dependent phosphoesterase, partial [Candidatus Methanomethylophilaceae archaeon]|nr:metal-dependent phosphoesterase [Candidatus Methanomethylophilaceae archaeon]